MFYLLNERLSYTMCVFMKMGFLGSPGQAAFSGGRETYGEGPGTVEEQPINKDISANRDSEVLDRVKNPLTQKQYKD